MVISLILFVLFIQLLLFFVSIERNSRQWCCTGKGVEKKEGQEECGGRLQCGLDRWVKKGWCWHVLPLDNCEVRRECHQRHDRGDGNCYRARGVAWCVANYHAVGGDLVSRWIRWALGPVFCGSSVPGVFWDGARNGKRRHAPGVRGANFFGEELISALNEML